MRPLQSIAMGLVIVALRPELSGYDVLPDPLGWLLVLHGVTGLPADLWQRAAVVRLALLAGVVSVALWFPQVTDALYDTHPALGWAVNLPQLGFAAVLARGLGLRAAAAVDGPARRWLRVTAIGFVAAALLPVLVLGAGVASLEILTYVTAALALLAFILLLFTYSARPWTGYADPASPADPAAPDAGAAGST